MTFKRISPKVIISSILVAGVVVWLAYVVFGFSSTSAKYGIFGDEGIFLSGADRILRGEIPHKDFYTLLPAASYYPLAIFFRLFGDSYVVAQFFVFLNALGLAGAMFWLGWRLLRWWGSVPAAIFLVFIFPAWPYVSHHWVFLLFALLATCCCFQQRPRWHVAAGVLSGISFAVFPQKALFTILAQVLIVALFNQRTFRARLSALLWYASGAAFVILLQSWWLVQTGTWDSYIQQVFVDTVKYYPNFVISEVFFTFNNVAVLLAVGIVGFGIFFLFRRRFASYAWRTYAAILLLHILLLVSILYHLELYHMIQVIPPALVLIFSIIVFFARAIRGILQSRALIGLAALIFSAMIVSVSVPFALAYESSYGFGTSSRRHFTPFSTPRGTIVLNHDQTLLFVEEYETIHELVTTTLSGKNVFFFPYAPGYYYFFQLRNVTSFDFIAAEMIAQTYRDQLAQELENVDVVILLPTSWVYDTEGAFLQLITPGFPYREELLAGRVLVLSRLPLQTPSTVDR